MKTPAERSYEVLVSAIARYNERLQEAIRAKESGLHRLVVKLDSGNVHSVTLELQQTYGVDGKRNSR